MFTQRIHFSRNSCARWDKIHTRISKEYIWRLPVSKLMGSILEWVIILTFSLQTCYFSIISFYSVFMAISSSTHMDLLVFTLKGFHFARFQTFFLNSDKYYSISIKFVIFFPLMFIKLEISFNSVKSSYFILYSISVAAMFICTFSSKVSLSLFYC